MKKFTLLLISLALGTFILSGCGMGGQEPGSATGGIVSGEPLGDPVGIGECLSCHMDEVNPGSLSNVVGDTAGSNGFINGPHANSNDNPSFGSHVDSCGLQCHDQLDQGGDLISIEAELGIDLGGIDRPVIVCESCHGLGANHFGTGTVEYPRPDAARCGQCHNEDFPHHSHPAGGEIIEKYSASRHSTSVNTAASHVPDFLFDSKCSKCHSDEKIRGVEPQESGYANVQCKTCHNPHNPHEYQVAADIVNSSQYNTCTNCHEMTSANHGISSTHSWADYQGGNTMDSAMINGVFEPEGMISDTHWDNPATVWIEGYNINPADPRACSSCHDVHEATIQEDDEDGNLVSANSINEQWARSAHAGELLEKKEAAIELAYSSAITNSEIYENTLTIVNGSILNGPGVTNSTGDLTFPGVSFAYSSHNLIDNDEGHCRRCHTSTGFKYLAETGDEPYDLINGADFFGFYNTTENEREMVYCWACHEYIGDGIRGDDYSFGAYKSNKLLIADNILYNAPAGRIANIPDMAASNACLVCHSGRGSGEDLKPLVAVSNATTAWTGLATGHYAAAGGVLFRTIGFENAPAGEDYEDPAGFAHGYFALGTEGAWGNNGSCVACHMKHDEGHSMEAAIINGNDVVTEIPAYGTTCYICHGPDEEGFTDFMNEQMLGFNNALTILKNEIEASGKIVVSGRYPYYKHTNGSPYDNWDYAELMAAFNYNMLSHEPAAYVHNSRYARRLIYDSLDILDGGGNNESVVIDPAKEAYDWLGEGARP